MSVYTCTTGTTERYLFESIKIASGCNAITPVMSNSLGIVLIICKNTIGTVLNYLTSATPTITGDTSLIVLFQRIAVRIVGVRDPALLADSIICIVLVLGRHTGLNPLHAIAHVVVGVACTVVTVDRIGDGLGGQW